MASDSLLKVIAGLVKREGQIRREDAKKAKDRAMWQKMLDDRPKTEKQLKESKESFSDKMKRIRLQNEKDTKKFTAKYK